MAWVVPSASQRDRELILGAGGVGRVHVVEYGWLERIRTVELFAYRLPALSFRPFGEPTPHAHVSSEAVEPLGAAEAVGDLFRLHEGAGIELRVVGNLWAFVDAARVSSVGFSGIRLANGRPRELQA